MSDDIYDELAKLAPPVSGPRPDQVGRQRARLLEEIARERTARASETAALDPPDLALVEAAARSGGRIARAGAGARWNLAVAGAAAVLLLAGVLWVAEGNREGTHVSSTGAFPPAGGVTNIADHSGVGDLSAVSCPSSSLCVAVGSGSSAGLIEMRNSGSWEVARLPHPATGEYGFLLAVSCGSPSSCMAVGLTHSQRGGIGPFAESWDGRVWALEPTAPLPPDRVRKTCPTLSVCTYAGAVLDAVSCTSASSCVAVGTSDRAEPLVENWNGSQWSLAQAANGSGYSLLQSISCPSPSSCVAVGHDDQGGKQIPIAESFDGGVWHLMTSPMAPTGAQYTSLDSVWCASATDCVAVGSSQDGSGRLSTLAETWDGSAWSIKTSPPAQSASTGTGGLGSRLTSLSCLSATACIAIGYEGSADYSTRTLADVWNGASWTIQPTPDVKGDSTDQLSGVACLSARTCLAVGVRGGSKATAGTLAEVWNGKRWVIQRTP
jgi:hypothetical protein